MAIENDNPDHGDDHARRRGPSLRSVILAALAVLILGIVGGGWAMSRFLAENDTAAAIKVVDVPPPNSVAADAPVVTETGERAIAPATVDGANALAARVAELEQRLSRLTLEAASASGNASRAEGLLVAFAVRRALDRGLPLGYLDAQLRLRFGDDQPNAVKTIIETSRDPITLEHLRVELDNLAPQLVGRHEGNGSLWTGLRRELSELFVVRPAGTQSTRASERLERARRYLAGGQVDKAIEEVQAMPGVTAANEWLIDARRYHEARRALDLIETAAILEPRDGAAAAMARKQAATTP